MNKQELEQMLIKKGYYRLEDVEDQKDIWVLYDWLPSIAVPFNADSVDIFKAAFELVDDSIKMLQRKSNDLSFGLTYAEKLELEYAELVAE